MTNQTNQLNRIEELLEELLEIQRASTSEAVLERVDRNREVCEDTIPLTSDVFEGIGRKEKKRTIFIEDGVVKEIEELGVSPLNPLEDFDLCCEKTTILKGGYDVMGRATEGIKFVGEDGEFVGDGKTKLMRQETVDEGHESLRLWQYTRENRFKADLFKGEDYIPTVAVTGNRGMKAIKGVTGVKEIIPGVSYEIEGVHVLYVDKAETVRGVTLAGAYFLYEHSIDAELVNAILNSVR